MPDTLLEVLRRRFPNSLLPLGELVPSADGKLRYFKPIRLELYRAMLEWIDRWGEGTEVYTCMERPDVWEKTFGQNSLRDADLGGSLVQIVTGGSPYH